ncbi:hypothetical protein [Faecalibaculum rodentium]|uniref:hypothetical protein n=2 Tax=Faecalibaculum rodentium TaxID=1702221 RepID=UPI00256ECC18|nr:hypothetical protein [Faecalibaculum rodentium]
MVNASLIMVFAHWISHTTYCKVTGIAKRRDIPVEYINSRNRSISERELPEIVRRHGDPG